MAELSRLDVFSPGCRQCFRRCRAETNSACSAVGEIAFASADTIPRLLACLGLQRCGLGHSARTLPCKIPSCLLSASSSSLPSAIDALGCLWITRSPFLSRRGAWRASALTAGIVLLTLVPSNAALTISASGVALRSGLWSSKGWAGLVPAICPRPRGTTAAIINTLEIASKPSKRRRRTGMAGGSAGHRCRRAVVILEKASRPASFPPLVAVPGGRGRSDVRSVRNLHGRSNK